MSTTLFAPSIGDPAEGIYWAPSAGDPPEGVPFALAIGEELAASMAAASAMAWAVIMAAQGVPAVDPGTVIWPATTAGDSHTAVVPHTGSRVVVQAGDGAGERVKAFSLHAGDVQTYTVDFRSVYLAQAQDQAATFMSAWADAGVTVATSLAPGAALTSGVVDVQVTPPAQPGTYRVHVQMRTQAGRERVGVFDVAVSAALASVKTVTMREQDREFFNLDFLRRHLDGVGDTAATLLGFDAPAGITAQARLVGGVVQLMLDNPAPGRTYIVSAQISTARGDRKTAALSVAVAP